MSNIVLLVSTDGRMDAPMHATREPIRISLPQGATLGARDEASGRWAPLLAEKSRPRAWTSDWSILD